MSKRILLVDDEAEMIDLLEKVLVFLGYEVSMARNGEEAVEKALLEIPDLIIMDARMPKIDGLQAASAIRNNPTTQSIPILAATGLATPRDTAKCLQSGCDAVLMKPFTAMELEAAIQKLLKKSAKLG